MKNRYFLKGFCGKDRAVGLREVEEIVNNRGFIVDFKMFSDIAISMVVEIEEQKVVALYQALKDYMTMSDLKEEPRHSEKECVVLLNITFTRGSGKMRIEVPAS